MNAPAFARCYCPECVKLDRLPVRRHGIPHAWQPSLLSAGPVPAPRPDVDEGVPPPAPSVDALPLFAGELEPSLF